MPERANYPISRLTHVTGFSHHLLFLPDNSQYDLIQSAKVDNINNVIIERYFEVVRDALARMVEVGATYAGALALVLGTVFVMGTLAWAFGKREWTFEMVRPLRVVGGVVALCLVLFVGASALRATRFLAQRDLRMRDRALATSNPSPDAPPVVQTGPAVAALRERTYSSRLSLPPSFLNRLGAEGLSVLAPYLSDPSAQNVIRLRNSFARSGRTAVLARQVTVLEEDPIPFADSRVRASFKRLPGRAFDCAFEARYVFRNTAPQARTVHFLFSLPQAGTVRDLQVRVGKQNLSEQAPDSASQGDGDADQSAAPRDPNTYEWKGAMAAGEQREAVVSYSVTGARTWSYALGSERRRVEGFSLDADTGGDIRFARGSLQPLERRGNVLGWRLTNVVTAQSLSLVFPSDKEGDQLYIQALTALPICLVLFCGGALALGIGRKPAPSSLRLAASVAIFALGLGGASVETALEPLTLLLVAPMVGALGASALLGRRFLLVAVPVALLPATFLSAHYTGLLVLSLIVLTLLALWFEMRQTGRTSLPASRPSNKT